MTVYQKKSGIKLVDLWKIDKFAYDNGQAPEWVNSAIDPDNFLHNDNGIYIIANEFIKFNNKSIPYEGNYLGIDLDEDGNIPKKPKIFAESAEVVEDSDKYAAFKK